jgi:hypothetical protein
MTKGNQELWGGCQASWVHDHRVLCKSCCSSSLWRGTQLPGFPVVARTLKSSVEPEPLGCQQETPKAALNSRRQQQCAHWCHLHQLLLLGLFWKLKFSAQLVGGEGVGLQWSLGCSSPASRSHRKCEAQTATSFTDRLQKLPGPGRSCPGLPKPRSNPFTLSGNAV